MLDFLDGPITAFLEWLNGIYTPSVAAIVAFAILGWTAILWWQRQQKVAPLIRALRACNASVLAVRAAADPNEARIALTSRYHDLADAVLRSGHADLRHAWDEFEESIIDPAAQQLSSSVHANEFFDPLVDRSRGLFWWANIMVAIGLVFTFLGIMAALGNTAIAIGKAGDAAGMQDALQQLLKVTAAKFMTSFAGVLASILLRWGDHRLQGQVRREVSELVETLERGLLYQPPQRIAADQLRQLEQIATAQTRFAQELAVAIGEKLNEQFAPMVTVLGDIDGGIKKLKDELVGGVGGAVANTLNETAGKEMQALAAALSLMSERLGNIPDQISASADDANAKIENAALLFSQASGGMQSAFDELGRKIREMGEAVVAQQQAASDDMRARAAEERQALDESGQRNRTELAEATTELKSLVASMGGTLAALGEKLTAQAEAGARASEDLIAKTKGSLEEAAFTASRQLADAAANAAKVAAEASAQAVEDAMRTLSERMESATRALTSSIETSATKVQAFGGSIERASSSAEDQAAKLANAGTAAERVAGMLDATSREVISQLAKASESLTLVSKPLESASTAIENSVQAMLESVKAQSVHVDTQVAAFRELARQFDGAAVAAQNAWQSYVDRFEQVDEALANALSKMEMASRESAAQLTDYANKLDSHLADAVNRLAAAIDELDDLPDAIKEASADLRRN